VAVAAAAVCEPPIYIVRVIAQRYGFAPLTLSVGRTRKDAMYHQVISQCVQNLKNLQACLDKAEQYASASMLAC
jgi:hypothetical protein